MSLGQFILRRSLQGIAVVWGIITAVFLLRFLSPGNPVNIIAPRNAPPELRQQIAAELGLNKPTHIQYLDYLGRLLQGDMGYSYISRTEASSLIISKLPATIELAVTASIVAIIISIPLGVISATRRHELPDYIATVFSLGGISTPNFWLGIILVLVLSVQFDLLPTSRRPIGLVAAMTQLTFERQVGGLVTWLSHIILPSIMLGTYFTALITRLTRSGMIDELGKAYIEAARAKGLPEALVRYHHALRNTLIPIVTVLGLQLGTLLGGAVLTEAVFAWPGIGTLLIEAINSRDWPLIQGSLIIIGCGFVLLNIAVDALYGYLDPRVVAE